MTAPLRLAIVGCGAAARRCHLPAIPQVPSVRLAALVDPDPSHAEAALRAFREAGGQHPVRLAVTLDEVLPSMDAAVVSAPHAEHERLAHALLRAGRHVLMEKPLATRLDQADRLVAAVEATPGVVFAMAQPFRLFPARAWLRSLLGAGSLGTVSSLEWLEGKPYTWEPVTSSLFDRGLAGGGVLIDKGSHVLDLLLWCLGPDAEVAGYVDNAVGGVETDARVSIRLGEVSAVVELSRLRRLANACTVTGSEAVARIDIDFPGRCSLVTRDGRVLVDGEIEPVPPAQREWVGLFEEQLRNFAAAACGAEPAYASVRDGWRVVRLIESCYFGRVRTAWPQPWLYGPRRSG